MKDHKTLVLPVSTPHPRWFTVSLCPCCVFLTPNENLTSAVSVVYLVGQSLYYLLHSRFFQSFDSLTGRENELDPQMIILVWNVLQVKYPLSCLWIYRQCNFKVIRNHFSSHFCQICLYPKSSKKGIKEYGKKQTGYMPLLKINPLLTNKIYTIQNSLKIICQISK